MPFTDLIQPLLEQRELSEEQASTLMAWLLDGEALESQIAATLTALKIKGVTPTELGSFAKVLRSKAKMIDLGEGIVDTCGTGGGLHTFNISTAAAFVAAGAGVKVAKHGNRAVTSKCGSADVLEALGANLQDDFASLKRIFDEAGIVFMFAPVHHPGMRHVGKTRRELGFRSVFNQLGPLANPAGAKRQLLGVFESAMVEPMAHALTQLNIERAVVVYGEDGLDEISPCGPTKAGFVMGREVRMTTITPADFGLTTLSSGALDPGTDIHENAEILRTAIGDVDSQRAKAILPTAATTIWLSGQAEDLEAAKSIAQESISSGKASQKLEAFVGACSRA
jgi:anthranilate phosphoribosyltransferase